MQNSLRTLSHDKNQIRWELAYVSNRLNKLLKEIAIHGHRISIEMEIHDLRAERDMLMEKLND